MLSMWPKSHSHKVMNLTYEPQYVRLNTCGFPNMPLIFKNVRRVIKSYSFKTNFLINLVKYRWFLYFQLNYYLKFKIYIHGCDLQGKSVLCSFVSGPLASCSVLCKTAIVIEKVNELINDLVKNHSQEKSCWQIAKMFPVVYPSLYPGPVQYNLDTSLIKRLHLIFLPLSCPCDLP